MKLFIKKIAHSVLLASLLFSFVSFPNTTKASTNDNVIGYAYSDMPNASDEAATPTNHYGGRGLGWISLNNTNNTAGAATFGVNLNRGSGDFSGYGWNDLGGYVNFSPSFFPPGSPAIDAHGAHVDPTCLRGTTACAVTGWIQFTSAAPHDQQAGGWDGFVKLSDASWTLGVSLLAPDNTGTRKMLGYGWGDTVVGWVDFSHATVKGDLCPNIPGDQSSIPTGMTIDKDGNCVQVPVCPDPLVSNPAIPPVPACVCPVTLKAPVNGSCETPSKCPDGTPMPSSGICPTINPKCPDGSIMPSSGVCPGGEVDQCRNLDGFQGTVSAPYTQVIQGGVKNCYIIGCTDPYANNTTPGANMSASPNICTYDQGVETCKTRGDCPNFPTQPKHPIYIET